MTRTHVTRPRASRTVFMVMLRARLAYRPKGTFTVGRQFILTRTSGLSLRLELSRSTRNDREAFMAKSLHVLPGLAFAAIFIPSPARAASTPQEAQLVLAAHPAAKVTVRREGWTRVTQPELVAARLDPQVDPGLLRLLTDGTEQPLNVTGNGDATFDADEAIEFYGRGRDTLWTDARTYWLTQGAAAQRFPKVVYPRGEAPPSTFLATSRVHERRIYYARLLNGDASNFFSASVDANGTTETLPLHHLAGPA